MTGRRAEDGPGRNEGSGGTQDRHREPDKGHKGTGQGGQSGQTGGQGQQGGRKQDDR